MMAKVIQMSEAGPLSSAEELEYKEAEEKVYRGRISNALLGANLESKFRDTKRLLIALTGGKDTREKFFVNAYSDRELREGIGIDALQEYLIATEKICNQISEWEERKINRRFPEELRIIEKYKRRYDRYHKN